MSSDSQDIPERLGRYEILERLAAGGMGEVFVGRFVGPGGFIKPVAVKRIHPHLAGDEMFIHMLHDEANVAAAIRHPNIVSTIDVGSEAGNHFVVLDYVSGDSLSRLLRDQKKKGQAFPDWLVAWIGAETASALHAAHEAKTLAGESLEIIHRDVSLSNVLLSDAGHPMLFDFGVAKATQRMVHTQAGELKGKLPYMAPETFRGAPIDRTVDVFSLGVMLYELATGISPFARGSDLDTITALQSAVVDAPSRVRPASIQASLDPIILRAMARERHERYATAAQVEQDLRAWARANGAPHDAASASAWVMQNFPERSADRKALLARIASAPSGSWQRNSQPSSLRSKSGLTPPPSGRTSPSQRMSAPTSVPYGQTPAPHAQSSPGYQQTQALYGPTPVPYGQTPAPQGQTPVPYGQSTPSYDKTQALYGATPVPYGQTPPPLSSPSMQPRTDASIPGVSRVDTNITAPNFSAPPAPQRAASGLHVMLGVASTVAIGAIVAVVLLVSKDKPEAGPSTNAAPPPDVPAQPADPAPVVAVPQPTATAEPAVVQTPPTAAPQVAAPKTGVVAPRPKATATSTSGKKGGPLVRSYD